MREIERAFVCISESGGENLADGPCGEEPAARRQAFSGKTGWRPLDATFLYLRWKADPDGYEDFIVNQALENDGLARLEDVSRSDLPIPVVARHALGQLILPRSKPYLLSHCAIKGIGGYDDVLLEV